MKSFLIDNSDMEKIERATRSTPTKIRILEAAKSLFAELGFDRTTVRLVAAKADIHPSMIIRYFGSKERLFAAAVDFDLQLPDFAAMKQDERGRTLALHLLERWEGPDAGDELPALLRVAVTHPDGKAILHQLFKEQLAPTIAKLHPPKQAATCAALLATQALGLAFTRYVAGIPGVVSLSEKQIVEFIGETFQRYFDL